MRKISTLLILATSLLFTSSHAFAGSSKYKSTLTAIPANTDIRIDVALGEDLAYRADNFPKKSKICSPSKSGFVCGGFLGQKDLDNLTKNMKKKVSKSFAKRDLAISDDAALILKIKLLDAQNNRPTIGQQSRETSLSFRSFSLGGAKIEAELFTKDGTSLGTVKYAYYDNDFDEFTQNTGTWTDARIAISRFSNKLAREFAKHSHGGT